ncbi:hypothetical protein CHS0354_012794 [Potamilus streckersoni]|uniref:Bursicon n=1 Tax=Potamilus streckersoni TaxID=2493646 RepID=A0AAE0VJY6_9BIVA|nr:hypothetical protein CHS0354_012794 [Potamilus streckersoni]
MAFQQILQCLRQPEQFRSLSGRKRKQLKSDIVGILIALFLIVNETSASCSKRIIVQSIRYKHCLPKRLLSYACVGSCLSSVRIDTTNQTIMERTCNRCQETVRKATAVQLLCPNPNNSSSLRKVSIDIEIPMECMCTSCENDQDNNVSVMPEIHRHRHRH